MIQSLFVLFAFFSIQTFAADLSFRAALLQQDANNPELIEALGSTTIKNQKSALNALTKISTNGALRNLLDARPKILPTNIRQYCNALGQKYLISVTATRFAMEPHLRAEALSLLQELAVGVQAPSHCFEAFAKLSSRTEDTQVEALFKTFQIEKPEFRKVMSPQNLSQILLEIGRAHV